MKKVLIVNLRPIGDVYATAHLVNAFVQQEGTQVSLLTYAEASGAANNISGLHSLFEIDRKEILTLKTNKLFSDGFALEQFFNQIQVVKTEQWDLIVNYSNDVISTYVTSYLKQATKNVVGAHFNEHRNLVIQNDWEILFNDILSQETYSPIHLTDCYHRMTGTSAKTHGQKLIANPEYDLIAKNHISKILRKFNRSEMSSKIIGIQLRSQDVQKDIELETLEKVISLIKANSQLIPMLLISPNQEERNLAKDINLAHNNEIIVVEADYETTPSVLKNIDLLVTPDTAIKHIADLVETPVLEITFGATSFLKQGTYSSHGLILADEGSNASSANTRITENDIMASILFALTKSKSIKPNLSSGVTLYETKFDTLGIRYAPVAGNFNTRNEAYRLMSRQLITVIFDESQDLNLYQDICALNERSVQDFIKEEKASITHVMKDLLATLRSLLQSVENRKNAREFVSSLSKLLANAEADSLVKMPIHLFKSKVESINAKTFEENAKEVEVLLYELKTDMQKVIECLNNLEKEISAQKVETMIVKTSEAIRVQSLE